MGHEQHREKTANDDRRHKGEPHSPTPNRMPPSKPAESDPGNRTGSSEDNDEPGSAPESGDKEP